MIRSKRMGMLLAMGWQAKTEGENELQAENSNPRPKPREEGPPAAETVENGKTQAGADGLPRRKPPSPAVQKGNNRQATRMKKEESRTKRELKAKMRKEKAMMKRKKKKEHEERMRKKGEKLTKNQPKIVEWLRSDGGGQRKAHTGGKKGVG